MRSVGGWSATQPNDNARTSEPRGRTLRGDGSRSAGGPTAQSERFRGGRGQKNEGETVRLRVAGVHRGDLRKAGRPDPFSAPGLLRPTS